MLLHSWSIFITFVPALLHFWSITAFVDLPYEDLYDVIDPMALSLELLLADRRARKNTSLTKNHALTITHLHRHPPHLHKLTKHAIAVNANLVHFLSHSNHCHTDMQLIPLEKIRSSRDSVRKARESHLIDKAMTLEPHGLNRRDELL